MRWRTLLNYRDSLYATVKRMPLLVAANLNRKKERRVLDTPLTVSGLIA